MTFYGNWVLRINRTAPRVTSVLGHFGANHFGPGRLGPNHFTGLLGSAFSGNNFDFGTRTEFNRTVSEYHNQLLPESVRYFKNDCEGVSKLKGMSGISLSTKMPGSITNKSTDKENENKKECM